MIKLSAILENENTSSEVQLKLIDIVSDSVNSEDMEIIKKTMQNFIDDSEATIIEGLVNDSDIYDFYIKYTSDIDFSLNEENFFEKSPKDANIFSLYDYTMYGTREFIKKCFQEILYK